MSKTSISGEDYIFEKNDQFAIRNWIMIFTFPTAIRLIDLTMRFGVATLRRSWSFIGCALIFVSIGIAGDDPIDSTESPDDDNTVKLKRIYGTAANGLSGFIELETTVNSITDEIKGGKSLAGDEGKKLLIELKRLTEQMSALRGRVDQLGQSPLGRQTLLQIQLDEAKLKCAKLIPERGDDHPDVKKAIREIDILSELLREFAEEQTSEPGRTFIVPAQGRSALDLANVLGPLFIETAAISGDAASGNVVVLVKENVPISKVAQIQSEIKARVEDLKPKSGNTSQVARVIHQPDAEDLNTESQIRELATRFRDSTNENERAKLKSQITELTTKLFDHRQARRYREFQALSNRVDQLKAANARRYANRNEIIRRRVDELLDPSAKREWDDVDNSSEASLTPSPASATVPETYAVEDASARSRTERSSAGSTTRGATVRGKTYESASSRAETPVVPERTYDGVTYGDWLRLLETERKPERLAAAMEAVSKLAIEKDVPRIARMIFLAEGGFEREKNKAVVDAGRAALNRLPAPVVFTELLVALSDTESYRSGRDFQAEVIGRVGSQSYKPLFEEHLDEFVTLATRALKEEPSDRDAKFLSSIVNVCVEFRRPPKDFPQLMTPALQYFSKGLPEKSIYGHDWIEIARWLVQYDPHLPGLKQVLVAQLGKNNLHVVDLLGELTLSGGPDTVPELIQHFELLVKQMGVQIVEYDRQHSDPSSGLRQEQPAICAEIVKVLSMFGENQLAGDFLAKLARYVPARSDAFKWKNNDIWNNDLPMSNLFRQIESAQTAVRQFKVAADPDRCQVRLPEFFKMNGYWNARSKLGSVRIYGLQWDLNASQSVDGATVLRSISLLLHEWNLRLPDGCQSWISVVDESKTPKEITLTSVQGNRSDRGIRIEGLYDLSDDVFVIQLARPGMPRPTKLGFEDQTAKEHQIQLTFDREKSAPSFYPLSTE